MAVLGAVFVAMLPCRLPSCARAPAAATNVGAVLNAAALLPVCVLILLICDLTQTHEGAACYQAVSGAPSSSVERTGKWPVDEGYIYVCVGDWPLHYTQRTVVPLVVAAVSTAVVGSSSRLRLVCSHTHG